MTDKKLTDNEIVKALECCVLYKELCPSICPMTNDNRCMINLRKFTLDLINRLQAENERLEKEAFTYKIRWAKSEVRENKAKAEAYKEFAERLKGNYIGITTHYDLKNDIDNLLKELVGEDNG